MASKRIRDMNYAAHEKMFMALRPYAWGKDWRTLAGNIGYTNEEIKNFECERNPAQSLINHWESSNATIADLLSHLKKMGRDDLLEDLQPFIAKTPTPEEAQKLFQERRVVTSSAKDTTRLQKYDALVIYASEDEEFANEIVKTLEGHPFYMSICIAYRDFVPGGCFFEKSAEIIENRCKKILLILSENFVRLRDGEPIYQAKMALKLSPGAREKCLIPILYQPCEIPTIYSFITHLDYTKRDTRKYFWNRLADSLGHSDSKK